MKRMVLFFIALYLGSMKASAQTSNRFDVNRDGEVNITDAMEVIKVILHGYEPLVLSQGDITIRKYSDATITVESGNGFYTVSSSDTDVASVSVSGSAIIIFGIEEGTATIMVTDTDSGFTKEISVTVIGNDVSYKSCPDSHHPHLIDLGLPSDTKWACCNVGATVPEEYGGYYAWGETEVKEKFGWGNYQHGYYDEENDDQLVLIDIGLDISGTQYDVAHVKWGGCWRMPTYEQLKELVDNTTLIWEEKNGVNGEKFIGPNGGTIFLPATGYYFGNKLEFDGVYSEYFSSTLREDYKYAAWVLGFDKNHSGFYNGFRNGGYPVRPVQ